MARLERMIPILLFVFFCTSPLFAFATGEYIDNQDGTLSDPKHGTMWQKSDDGVERSWREAEKYCQALELAGHKDWALPKAYQLEALIDTSRSPTIDPLFMVKPSYYWSATDSTTSTDAAKYVNFYYGNTYTDNKDSPYYALCVREMSATVGPQGLAVAFAGAPSGGKPLSISFTPTVTGGSEPYFYEWDFGDGGTSSSAKPTHEFKKEGLYKVLLTVSDNNGAISVANQDIELPLPTLPATGQGQEKTEEKSAPGVKDAVPVLADAPPLSVAEAARMPDKGKTGETATPSQLAVAAEPTPATAKDHSARTSLVSPGAAALRGFVQVMGSGLGSPHKDGALGHGLLAYAFASAMAGDGDWNKDGTISASEVQGYLDQAIKSLSKGQQIPTAARDGEDFAVCAPRGGSTYVLTVGVSHDLADTLLLAGQDAELVRKSLEDKCQSTKTMMLTASHANRQDILQALLQVGAMLTSSDTLIVYIGAASGQDNGRLNWYLNDTQKELAAFTGIFHEDLVQLLKSMPMAHLLILAEKN